MESRLSKNSVFKDYKGNYYRILNVCRYVESEEKTVVYQELYGKLERWSRPKDIFLGTVKSQYEGQLVPRFAYVAHLDLGEEIPRRISIPSFTTRYPDSESRERKDDTEWEFSAARFRSIEKERIDDRMTRDLFGPPIPAIADIKTMF